MKKTCFDYAMNYIYRFPKVEKELRIQLLKKWYFEKEIDDTILQLKQKGFVDDRMFCEMYLNSVVIKKWKPINVVKYKLIEKWVNKVIVNEVINKLNLDIGLWMEEKLKNEILKLKNKWDSGFDIIQRLVGRGYSVDLVKKVIKNLTN
jgi:regulatory protein